MGLLGCCFLREEVRLTSVLPIVYPKICFIIPNIIFGEPKSREGDDVYQYYHRKLMV